MSSSWASTSAGRCCAPLSCAGPTFRIVDEVHITPVNYGVDQPLPFRTAVAPSRSVEMGTQVAFEVEEITDGFARSVVVCGTARRLPDDQAERAELTSWIASSPKFDVVEIVPRR